MDDMSTRPSVDLARTFVERKLVPWPTFEAALIIGSIGHDEDRPDSDVDMVLLFDPLDLRIVPGEFVWTPADDQFHTIRIEASDIGGVQIDAKRLSVGHLEQGELDDGFKHELAHAIPLFDRSGRVTKILEHRLSYPGERRRALALRHRGLAGIYQSKVAARGRERWTNRIGWAGLIDLLVAGLEEVVLTIHAYNGEFPPYRYRRLLSVERLDWIPGGFAAFRDAVLSPALADSESNFLRANEAFDSVLAEVDARFRELGWAEDAGHLWVLSHPDLGFAYNMEEWKQAHEALLAERE